MKPEELDRLFRDELEKLEQVPELEWNEEAVWSKLSMRLPKPGAGFSAWTLAISTTLFCAVVYVLSMFYENPKPQPIEEKVIPIKVDTVKVESRKEMPEAKIFVRQAVKKRAVAPVALPSDSLLTVVGDTISTRRENIVVQPSVSANTFLRRRQLMSQQVFSSDFKFVMPSLSFSKVKVNNTLDLKNLATSLQAERAQEQNRYYFYEYNKNYVPSFNEYAHPKFQRNTVYIFNQFAK